MKRSTRQLARQWVLIGALLVLGGATSAWAQNTFPPSGNVGIGTTTPVERLQVSGGNLMLDNNSSIKFTTNIGGTGWMTITVDPNNRLVFRSVDGTIGLVQGADGGRVGLGTTQPLDNLQVGDGTGTNNIRIAKSLAGAGNLIFDRNGTRWEIGLRANDDSLQIRSSGGVTALYLDTLTRNVGVGTANPAAKLHVAGDAQVDGNLAAKYQDVAEWVQTPSPLTPGTVVIIDPQGRNQVLPASESYDPRVAGVVSSQPGLLLGEAGEGKVKVAQSGRVKVKVDAAYGPIAAGDLLVTSPTPGHAMRSTPVDIGRALLHRPGTLLGKALEQLEGGRGEILVLLTLQ